MKHHLVAVRVGQKAAADFKAYLKAGDNRNHLVESEDADVVRVSGS